MPDDDSQPLVKINAIGLFLIGMRVGALECIWLIHPAPAAVGIGRSTGPWRDMLGGLDLFIKSPYVPEGLGRCMKSAVKLREWCAKLEKQFDEYKSQGKTTDETVFPYQVVHELVRHMDTFRTESAGDTGDLPLYLIPERLGLPPKTLLQKPGGIFGTLEPEIMAIAGPDVLEAGRCLSFGAWTAFAFHFLRACELVILKYCEACGQPQERGSWKTYLTVLGQTPGVTRGMKRALDQLKRWDRDEIMHPARIVTEPEAESLLDDIKSAMRSMVIDIKARWDAANA